MGLESHTVLLGSLIQTNQAAVQVLARVVVSSEAGLLGKNAHLSSLSFLAEFISFVVVELTVASFFRANLKEEEEKE